MKNILTLTGIRPDFIRMSEIFRKLDTNFNHILVHTGQHFDTALSDIFFKDLNIRKPDFNLEIGGKGKEHYHQNAELSIKLFKLLNDLAQKPDLIIFLGDSNSVLASVPLKKEGYKIAHIEAGMRSGDKRMLEEINRTVCDHCSDIHFVYHEDYKQNLIAENLPEENIFVVGNTIVEVFNKNFKLTKPSTENYIILDIHRPENFNYKNRLFNIVQMIDQLSYIYGLPIYLLNFKKTLNKLKEFNIKLSDRFIIKELLSYTDYLKLQHNSKFIVSDSGTAQEEAALLNKPVVVPRDFTERPESILNHCSKMIDVNDFKYSTMRAPFEIINWIDHKENIISSWLGNGDTSELIINQLKKNE